MTSDNNVIGRIITICYFKPEGLIGKRSLRACPLCQPIDWGGQNRHWHRGGTLWSLIAELSSLPARSYPAAPHLRCYTQRV